jgi:AP-4 complex subunit epsilon-1
LQIDKSLPFLSNYINQAIENGARPYVSESERYRSASTIIQASASQYQHDMSSAHSLRFEAYELPKPRAPTLSIQSSSVPSVPTITTDLVPVSEATYTTREEQQNPKVQTLADQISAEIGVRLRLDGVQKKWGRQTYSSPSAPSISSSSTQKPSNGMVTSDTIRENTLDSRKQQIPEVSAEKQKLAASLFGKKTAGKKTQAGTRRPVKESQPAVATSAPEPPKENKVIVPAEPPPDLLDLGEASETAAPTIDPFKQLEGLLGPGTGSDVASVPGPSVSALATTDLISMLTDMPPAIDTKSSDKGVISSTISKKGPNVKDALQKDATARQVGVTLSGNNPNLFKDLFG